MQQMTSVMGRSPLLARPSGRAGASTNRRTVRPVRAVATDPAEAVPFLSDSEHLKAWGSTSWRNYPALQQPSYPDRVRPGGANAPRRAPCGARVGGMPPLPPAAAAGGPSPLLLPASTTPAHP
jgi:hypothetical protein